ncbi:MAG: ferrous iron transporter B [Thermoleophilia bacterium]
MSCHDPGGAAATGIAAARVLLVGEPNVGKSTLFNTLTGARQRIVNAPGTTVELASGVWSGPDGETARELVDLPGTHSLLARSLDERVTADAVRALAAEAGAEPAQCVIVVVDATALERSLYLVAQVAETGVPFVVALTMLDRACRPGDPEPAALAGALGDAIGVPVVAVDPRRRRDAGLEELALAVDAAPGMWGTRPAGLPPLSATGDDDLAHAEALFTWVEDACTRVRTRLTGHLAEPPPPRTSLSDRLDAVLLNPWAGIPVFLAVVFALFELTTRLAAPLQDLIQTAADRGPVAGTTWLLHHVGLGGTWVQGLLVDGVYAGVVTVLTFLPVMGVMFLALGVLEGSGYMARAALVADRAMRALGLDGRALLPLIVGFGCNLPALAATRTLPHARHRLLTGLLIPLTSCSARLTVYVLLATTFFPGNAGLVIFGMYVASIVLVLGAGLVLRGTLFRDLSSEPFMLVLPHYQWPHLRTLSTSAWVRVRAFVTGAGTVIVATTLALWLLTTIPAPGGHGSRVDGSLYGSITGAVAPVLAPAGFGDQTAAAALVTGFVAKEVVVGSLAESTALNDGTDTVSTQQLRQGLRRSFAASSGGNGGAAALAFMVFVLAYTPCVAALAEQRRLFGWRPTLAALSAQLVAAWVLAVVVFHVGASL